MKNFILLFLDSSVWLYFAKKYNNTIINVIMSSGYIWLASSYKLIQSEVIKLSSKGLGFLRPKLFPFPS